MPDFSWIFFVLFVSFISVFFTLRSIRSRQKVFIIQSIIGVVVGIYGFWAFSTKSEATYFKALGLPLSGIVAISLCFGALTLENIFSVSLLKNRVCPILSVFFVGWALIVLLIGYWKNTFPLLPVPIWNFVFLLIVIAAFVSSVVWKFNLTWFQIFLPVLFASFLLTLAESQAINTVFAAIGSIKASFENRVNRFNDSFLTVGVWSLFYLFSYLYLNTRVNKIHLKQNAFADKLPKAGVVLVMSSFFYQFPEFENLRKLLPIELTFVDYGFLFVDLLIIPLFLLSSGWPYIRDSLVTTILTFTVFACSVIALSVSIASPLSVAADDSVMGKGKQIIANVTSWNPKNVERATGYQINRDSKSYFIFASELGMLKDIKNMAGEVYTFLTPLHGLTNNALLSADLVFEKGTAKFYLRMVKDRKSNWNFRAAELYDREGFYFRIYESAKAEVSSGGSYQMLPIP